MRKVSEAALRRQVVATAKAMSACGLSPHKSGNVSVRRGNAMLVTPSGLAYAGMKPDDIVHVGTDGAVRAGEREASSEAPMHLAIYAARPEAGAIVHCHSMAATALSTLRKSIPAFHYMVAVAGGKDIACARYQTFGTPALAKAAVAALKGRKACLLANHGQIAFGETLDEALSIADQVEQLARMYMDVLQVGKPTVLGDAEMKRVMKKFETYGKG
ncbi:MAG: class II aldolase/adducin family protein [Hyphomicrobiales bacterium]|nr:class II aldolase/adducin family protein [Hyphomicrobiales bacterium]